MGLTENPHKYDVAVIGGGPAGSTLSTFLAKQGYQVLLLEREKFPRFHVGESLLPATQKIWQKLELTEALEDLAAKKYKDSAELRIGLSPQHSDYEYARIDFTEPNNWPAKDFPQEPYAYQVERSQFDLLLLNNARKQGVTVCEQAIVKEVIWKSDRAAGLRWKNADGVEQLTLTKFVADCSGRQALIARNQKLLEQDPIIQSSSVFGHFRNVTANPGKQQGAICVNFIENGWIWFIPLHSNLMSVGVVVNKPESNWWYGKSPENILLTYINRYQFLRTRFESAQKVSKIRLLRNLSYESQKMVGNNWLLVGDANFFVDPFLSSGVQVAFKTAEQAAIAIDNYLQNHNSKPLKDYASWCQKYKFHVFVTMRLFYRMMKYKFAIQIFINTLNNSLKTKPNRLERGFIAWSLGNFDRYYLSVYLIWIVFWVLILISKIRHIFLRELCWSNYQEFCSEPDLKIETISLTEIINEVFKSEDM